MRTRSATKLLAVVIIAALGTGCGALMRLGQPDGDPIAYASGELRSREPHPMTVLDVACGRAIETLGYEESEATREAERVLWRARTAGGDRVEIQLIAKGAKNSELRIRVGVLGDETRSRLLLEHVHQSL